MIVMVVVYRSMQGQEGLVSQFPVHLHPPQPAAVTPSSAARFVGA